MNVTLRQLKGFVAAARLNSFSAGARELAMTQPAFSQLIAALEASGGVQLFDRTTRRMQLTEAGEHFLGMVERPLGDIDDACLYLRDVAAGKRGRLVFSSVGHRFVTAALARFKSAYPHVAVKVLDDPSAVLISRVLSRETDFGLGVLMEPHRELAFRALLRDEFVAVVQAGSRTAVKRRLTWRALVRDPLVLLPKQSSIRGLVDRQFAAIGIARSPDHEVQNPIAALSMVRAGMGVTVMPKLGLAGLNMEGLQAMRVFEPHLERSLGIISRADRPLAPPAAAYVELLFEEAAKSLPQRQLSPQAARRRLPDRR